MIKICSCINFKRKKQVSEFKRKNPFNDLPTATWYGVDEKQFVLKRKKGHLKRYCIKEKKRILLVHITSLISGFP